MKMVNKSDGTNVSPASVVSVVRSQPPAQCALSFPRRLCPRWLEDPMRCRQGSRAGSMDEAAACDPEVQPVLGLTQMEQGVGYGSNQMGFSTVNLPEEQEGIFQPMDLLGEYKDSLIGLILIMELSIDGSKPRQELTL